MKSIRPYHSNGLINQAVMIFQSEFSLAWLILLKAFNYIKFFYNFDFEKYFLIIHEQVCYHPKLMTRNISPHQVLHGKMFSCNLLHLGLQQFRSSDTEVFWKKTVLTNLEQFDKDLYLVLRMLPINLPKNNSKEVFFLKNC